MTVGSSDPVTYHLHRNLVCRESKFLKEELQGETQRVPQPECLLPDIHAHEFGWFVEYLYCGWMESDWLPSDTSFLTIARLYVVGHKLRAKLFQRELLRRTSQNIEDFEDKIKLISTLELCEALEVISNGLARQAPDDQDQICVQIYWYAARRIDDLRKTERFMHLLEEHPSVAVSLCMIIADDAEQPDIPCSGKRFEFAPETGC